MILWPKFSFERRSTRLVHALCLPAFFLAGVVHAAPAEKAVEPAPVSSEPQQTSASFGDWVLRCERGPDPKAGGSGASEAAKRVCEVAQSLVVQGQQAPIAQIAFGQRPTDASGAEMITVLLPTNIAFGKPPQIGSDEGQLVTLTFRRCLPGGCLADAKIDTTMLRAFRAATKPGLLIFTDAAERSLKLPVSLRGLPQALDSLSRTR